MDDKGVDIMYVDGYHIQCKRTERTPKFTDVLDSMPTDKVPIVLHKANRKRATVTLYKEDFYNLIKK